MPLVFSAIVPHPPQLTPGAKPGTVRDIRKTQQAFQGLEEHLYAAKPDLLIVISPHGDIQRHTWQLLLGETLSGNLEEFGNFAEQIQVPGSIGFSHRAKERAEDHGFPLLLKSDCPLDYATTIPLLLLLPHLPDLRVAPLLISGEDVSSHYEFGKMLREEVFATTDRIAVIASANLSHRLTRNSPKGFHKAGKLFDDKVRSALASSDPDALLTLPDDVVEDAVSCGLRPIALLLGLHYRRAFRADTLSYEYPHGIGYYTALIQSP